MTFTEQMLTITICAVTTMGTRMLPFLVFRDNRDLPGIVRYLGRVLPPAVFAFLVVYCLKDVQFLSGTYGIPEGVALIVTTVLHVWKRNMMLSMVAGTAVYMVLIHMV